MVSYQKGILIRYADSSACVKLFLQENYTTKCRGIAARVGFCIS